MPVIDFTQLGLFEFEGQDVVIFDHCNDGNHASFIELSGGALACFYKSPDLQEPIKALLKTMGEPFSHRELSNDSLVLLSRSVLTNMSHDMAMAVLYHEVGHLELKHIHHLEQGIMVDTSSEVEADAYAADRMGKKAMLDAIVSLIKTIANPIAIDKKISLKEACELLYSNKATGFQERLLALK